MESFNFKARGKAWWWWWTVAVVVVGVSSSPSSSSLLERKEAHKNAYATMMYMGTPRDYEFYVALRVLLRSLARLKVEADLVVIASNDVPQRWVDTMEGEDGAKVVRVKNVDNPYMKKVNMNKRFMLTLNKLYAWNLVQYERVVMLDSDNLFLQNTDELFKCGQFCAVFINPCIFHTGLFVLQPSEEVFKKMMKQIKEGRENRDGADQGFLVGYFDDLLHRPMFSSPGPNDTRLDGLYRLPLGYQMDASYFYLKLCWRIPCGPNSVITFPSAAWLKPWYWWSWPVLPLGLSWHQQRLITIGYSAELPQLVACTALLITLIATARLSRPVFSRLCFRCSNKALCNYYHALALKAMLLVFIAASYAIPFLLIPSTIHPLLGWSLYFLGSSALIVLVVADAFSLPALLSLTPSLLIFGVLPVMAFPSYSNGVVRALVVFAYSFLASPILWGCLSKLLSSVQVSLERDNFVRRELPKTLFTKPYSWQGRFSFPSLCNFCQLYY